MNVFRTVVPCLTGRMNSLLAVPFSQTHSLLNQCQSRLLVSLTTGHTLTKNTTTTKTQSIDSLASSSVLLSKINAAFSQPVRFYKVKRVLRRRCKGCYFEERFGRLYVECTLKPRHKQMKMVNKKYLYKDDYSEGKIHEAAHWNYRTDRFYRMGNNKFSRYNWLEGRLGTEI